MEAVEDSYFSGSRDLILSDIGDEDPFWKLLDHKIDRFYLPEGISAKKRKYTPCWNRPKVVCLNEGPVEFEQMQAQSHIQRTLDFYYEVFNRYSYDDFGGAVYYVLNGPASEGNAEWREKIIVYGKQVSGWQSPVVDLSITAHEITHGVLNSYVHMENGETGALFESLADVFGVMAKQYSSGQSVSEASWGVDEHSVRGKREMSRSLSNPGSAYTDHPVYGSDLQIAKMSQYRDFPLDWDGGGIHINSGIPSHAFYLVAMELGGRSWEKAGQIWYQTLPKLLQGETFGRFADKTVRTAEEIFGRESLESRAVKRAWRQVEVFL